MKKLCAVYMTTDKDSEYLEPSLETMSSYEWVDSIVVLKTDHDSPSVEFIESLSSEKAKFFGCNTFGGWTGDSHEERHKPVGLGGFDQISARNTVLSLAENVFNAELVMVVDPDEVFTEDTIKTVERANELKADAVWFSCCHLVGFHNHRKFPYHEGLFERFNKKLFDPHLRLFSVAGRRYTVNELLNIDGSIHNHTMHCGVEWGDDDVMIVADGFQHLHLPLAYGEKCSRQKTKEFSLEEFDYSLLPEAYKKIHDES